MSHRREQLASSLQRTIGKLIAQGLNDPRISGMISVTSVEVSPDGRHATVSVSVLPASAEKLTLQGLGSAAGFLRSALGRELRIRRPPTLHFQLDPSLKKQAQVLDAIRKAVGEPSAPGQTNSIGEEPQP
jgi:ribosome-binding factor A